MIKFAIQKSEWTCGDSETYFLTKATTTEPPIEGAVLETYIENESRNPSVALSWEHEAKLDENGKPYIATKEVFIPDPTYEDWCTVGTNHECITLDSEEIWGRNFPRWKYTRDVEKTVWTLTVETLEKIEELLDNELGMGLIWKYRPNGIKYYLEV